MENVSIMDVAVFLSMFLVGYFLPEIIGDPDLPGKVLRWWAGFINKKRR